jgi:2-iminobutanoate/2-iminopropanoate deaminase
MVYHAHMSQPILRSETCTLALLLAVALPSAAQKKPIQPAGSTPNRNFSAGIVYGDTLYVSGMVGRDASGNFSDKFEDEVKQALDNVGAVLKEAGFSFDDAVSVQVYLTDMGLFDRMNAVYTTYFKEPRPTRTTVGVAKLVGTAKIEITVTARGGSKSTKKK